MSRFTLFAVMACVFVCGLARGEGPPAATSLAIEYFTRHDESGTIKISPDGQFLAMTTGKFGSTSLAFISLKDRKIVSGVKAPDPYEIDDFYWVSPERVIYLIAQRYFGRAYPTRTGEIFAIDRDGGRSTIIYGYRAGEDTTGTHLRKREDSYASADLISVLKEDDKNILIAEQPYKLFGNTWQYNPDEKPQIIRLNVYSGSKYPLEKAPLRNASVLVDTADQVRVAMGLDDEFNESVSWKPDAKGPWVALKLPGFIKESLQPQRFSTDNRSMLFTGVREGESLAALYRLDLQTKAVEKLHAFPDTDVSGLISDFANRETVGVRGYADRPTYHWLVKEDPASKLYVGLQRAFAGQSVTITSATDDGRLAIAFVYSDTNPGEYYLFDTQAKKADFLRATRQWVDPRLMRPKQPVEIAARDGLKLHGYLTQPAGAGQHPLVVLPHGGPHGVRDTWAFDWEVQLLANRGYAVLQVNYRGSGGYGIDFEAAGFRKWGASMQDDLTDATRWAIAQGVTAADRVCIFGASYGGYAALMGAAREPTLYRCAIGYAGVYDLELMRSSGDTSDSRSGLAYLDKALGDDVTDLRARSPAYNAQHIQVPVLLIHGKEDRRADYEHAKRMKSALQKNGKTLEWMALSREGHGVFDEETRREVYERILVFLDKHLKGASTAPQQTAQQP